MPLSITYSICATYFWTLLSSYSYVCITKQARQYQESLSSCSQVLSSAKPTSTDGGCGCGGCGDGGGGGDNVIVYRGTSKFDDVFAFGTLLFELFAGRRPMSEASAAVAAARIRAGAMPKALAALQRKQQQKGGGGGGGGGGCTERLIRLIHRCWEYEAERRYGGWGRGEGNSDMMPQTPLHY